MEYQLEKFQNGLKELKLSLSDTQMKQFLTYYEILIERNKVMNLTTITEFDEVVEKHFLDSLCFVKALPEFSNDFAYDDSRNELFRKGSFKELRLLDLGTGAGFPGIPLKIAFPNLNIVLADSLNKRIQFLNDVIAELKLEDICAVHGRAEELARNPQYRQQFNVCVSRAVANLASLSEYCIPFVKIGGYFVSYKSAEVEEEAEQAKKAVFLMGGQISDIVKYQVPGSDYGRSLVLVEKKNGTPKTYPRKAGTPGRNPIK